MSPHTKKFFLALAATVVWFFIMRPFTPPNIVAFELAGTTEAASEIISTWWNGGHSWIRVDIGIYLDFIFIIAYCSALMFACRAAVNFSRVEFFTKISKQFIVLIWVAGLCDVIENMAMLTTLNEISQTSVSIAFHTATPKFGILLLVLIFILICVVTGLFTRRATT